MINALKQKRKTDKINLLKKVFLKDNFQEIALAKNFMLFLDNNTMKSIKDICWLYKMRWAREECLIEAIIRSRYIDRIDTWELPIATKNIVEKQKLLTHKTWE